MESSDIKHIVFDIAKQSADKSNDKQRNKKRVVTDHPYWNFTFDEMSSANQLYLVEHLYQHIKIESAIPMSTHMKLMMQQIRAKQYGYRIQDSTKELMDDNQFVTIERILELMVRCELKCYYCKDPVKIIYEEVRDPKQWSLERIDNAFGHTCTNVEIACLSCNLRRRTMYHERYAYTKRIEHIQKVGGP